VVVSGNRDREAITKQKVRYSAVDGRPEERGAEAPAGLVPWVSASWGTLFTWAEARPRPAAERARRNGVRRQGAPGGPAVRYWATPE
jgi:hypothetical protein